MSWWGVFRHASALVDLSHGDDLQISLLVYLPDFWGFFFISDFSLNCQSQYSCSFLFGLYKADTPGSLLGFFSTIYFLLEVSLVCYFFSSFFGVCLSALTVFFQLEVFNFSFWSLMDQSCFLQGEPPVMSCDPVKFADFLQFYIGAILVSIDKGIGEAQMKMGYLYQSLGFHSARVYSSHFGICQASGFHEQKINLLTFCDRLFRWREDW